MGVIFDQHVNNCFSGAYLLGPFPPELLAALGLDDLPIIPRDPHYFLPTPAAPAGGGGGYALFGSDAAKTRASFLSLFTRRDWDAHAAMQAELAALRDDFAPAMLAPPLSPEATADAYVRPALRRAFVDLATGPVTHYLARFGFESDLVRAMYAATDALSGVTAGPGEDGTGYNFLLHNMVRLPSTAGAWALLRGGMGTLTARLAGAARTAGAVIETGRRVAAVDRGSDGAATGVTLSCGASVPASAVVVNADPFTLSGMLELPPAARAAVDTAAAASRPATTAKLNLALSSLPRFACLPDADEGQHRTTSHLLVGAGTPRAAEGAVAALEAAADAARVGRVECEPPTRDGPGRFPPIEFYFHSHADPSVRDARGRHSAALFVQLAPGTPVAGALDAEAGWTPTAKARYADLLLDVVAAWAPDIRPCVADALLLAPPDIEARFGVAGGHIHHVSNTLPLDARFPHAVPGVPGLFCASAGTHPGGSVAGCGG
jgi:phytoene dehydrogenase-like protein